LEGGQIKIHIKKNKGRSETEESSKGREEGREEGAVDMGKEIGY
jgi:hypothetical protein